MCVETAFCDGLLHGLRRFEFRACIFVPEAECTIRANCCQCTMHRMEGDIVNRIDILCAVIGSHAMTFECEIVFGIRRVDLQEISIC